MLETEEQVREFASFFDNINKYDDLKDYRFILTDLETLILQQAIFSAKENIRDEKKAYIDYNYISKFAFIFYASKGLLKNDTIKKLVEIAYRKIKSVNVRYNDEAKRNDISLLEAMSFNNLRGRYQESISLEKFKNFCDQGLLFSSTTYLEEFVTKYRVALVNDYKKLAIGGSKISPKFYEDLSNICMEIGYSKKPLSEYKIDEISMKTDIRMKYVDSLVDEQIDLNKITNLKYQMDKGFKWVNEKSKAGLYYECDAIMKALNMMMHDLDDLIYKYNIKYGKNLKNPYREDEERRLVS